MAGMKDTLGDDLFVYPLRPGWTEPSTSRDAAMRMRPSATELQESVLAVLRVNPQGLTADELAEKIGRSILSVRPRVSELNKLGKIKRAALRRKNESGMSAAVWVLA